MTTPNKRAFVEVQFNWVFVLIVGAIILIFFVSIVNSQKKQSDQNLAFDVLSNIDLIMSGGLTVPKTGQIFDMPRLELEFDCNTLSVFGVTRQFPDKIVFAPDLLKGRQLVVWSQDWNVPFKATNFLYLTTSDVRYIFINPRNPQVDSLFENMPNMTREMHTGLSGLIDRNNYKIRIVYFGSSLPSNPGFPDFMQEMNDEDVTAVLVNLENKYIRFYEKDGNSFTLSNPEGEYYYYITDAEIYAAIFAEDEEVYKCSMQKAFKKLHYMSKIYEAREAELAAEYENEICEGLRAQAQMESISASAGSENIVTALDIIESIELQMGSIANSNQRNIENSCPSIY